MKNTAKKFLSLLLAEMMIFGAVAAGTGSVDFAEIGIKAEAADEYVNGYYTYTIDVDGNATIIDVNSSISGDVIIPTSFGNYPIVAIGATAFSGCNSVESVPYNVTCDKDYKLSPCGSVGERKEAASASNYKAD